MNIFQTSWGWMGVAASQRGIERIVLPKPSPKAVRDELRARGRFGPVPASDEGVEATLLREAQTQLIAFLANQRRDLDFPLDLSRSTPFQRQVWRTILRIPYGRVRSYRWVADRVGGAHYARAVGNALGANPVPIIVPCHRIVTSEGRLGGFTGGLPVKRKLLELEGTLTQLHMRRRGATGTP